ncbi:amine oxidase (flavin-containing)-like protein, partial [Leptotrombidium deliense]
TIAHHLVQNCKLKFNRLEYLNDGKDSTVKVSIIGAGLSGLYGATILQDLSTDYEILEASDRVGGRFYTHYFGNESDEDYAELGAMRFQTCKEYDRLIGNQTWSLMSFLNLHLKAKEKIKLIENFDKHENNFITFNGKSVLRSEFETNSDIFNFGKSSGGFIGRVEVKVIL